MGRIDTIKSYLILVAIISFLLWLGLLQVQKERKEGLSSIESTVVALEEDRYELSKVKEGLGRLKEYIKKIKEENNSLKEKIEQLNNIIQVKEREIVALNQNNITLKQRLEESLKMQDKLKERESFLKMELSGIKEQLNRRINSEKLLQNKIDKLTENFSQKEQKRQELIQELQGLKQIKDSLESELERLKFIKTQQEGQLEQLNSRINELNSSNEKLKNTISQLSELLNKKEIEIAKSKEYIISLEKELARAGQERESLISSLKEKEKDVYELNASLKKMELKIVALETELNLAKERQKKTREQLTQVTSLNTSLQQRLLDISNKLGLESTQLNINKPVKDSPSDD